MLGRTQQAANFLEFLAGLILSGSLSTITVLMSMLSWTSTRLFSSMCSHPSAVILNQCVHRCLRNGDGSSIGLLGGSSSMALNPALELRCCLREIPRDWDHCIFGTMMREKLMAALKEQRGMPFIWAFTQFLLFYCFKSCMALRVVIPRRWSGKSYLNLCTNIIL